MKKYLIYAVWAAAFYFALKYLSGAIFTAALSIAAAYPVSRATAYLKRRFRIPRPLSCVVILAAAAALFASVTAALFERAVLEIIQLAGCISDNSEHAAALISGLADRLANVLSPLTGGSLISGEDIYSAALSMLGSIAASLTGQLPEAAAKFGDALPNLLFTVVTVAAVMFYLGCDWENIFAGLRGLLPESALSSALKLRSSCVRAVKAWACSSILSAAITFVLLLLGLCLLRVDCAFAAAAIIALVDLLPAVGGGLCLIPWALYSLACGDRYVGFGLLILYAATTIAKQFIEPAVLRGGTGAHPLLSVVAMYVGMRLFGLGGAIAAPLFASAMYAAIVGQGDGGTRGRGYGGTGVRGDASL